MINDKLSKHENGQQRRISAEKTYKHEQWKKRQEAYHKIAQRDCYGIKKHKPA